MSICGKDLKVKNDSQIPPALGVCTGNLSLYPAYRVLRKCLLSSVLFLSFLYPSAEPLFCPRLNTELSDAHPYMTVPLLPPVLQNKTNTSRIVPVRDQS